LWTELRFDGECLLPQFERMTLRVDLLTQGCRGFLRSGDSGVFRVQSLAFGC